MEINGYTILGELKNENSGFSKWGFCQKNGRKYFIKEFLSPIYPMPGASNGLSQWQINKRIDDCKKFERRMTAIYNVINKQSDGNVVRIREFFRCGSKYYIVTDKSEHSGLSVKEISMLSYEKKKFLCKLIAHSMCFLHEKCFIHADIKPNNILVLNSDHKCTAKIIDFDCGFFGTEPPEIGEELNGDPVYFAPEAIKFVLEEDVALSCKMDVYALGILFHQYMTGNQPIFDTSKYDYVSEALLDGGKVTVDPGIPEEMSTVIEKMLILDPEKRISIEKVYESIKFN